MYSSLELKSPKLKSQLNSLGLESAHVDSIASSLRAARPSELLELSQQLDSAEQALSHAVANLESWLSSPLEQNCALPRGGSVLFVKVSPSATKEQIKHSIEERFDVQVAQVSTRTIRVKKVRHGFHFSTKPTWKKAMVRLRENPRILGTRMSSKQLGATNIVKGIIEEPRVTQIADQFASIKD